MNIKEIIEQNYNIKIKLLADAPQGWVAENFILHDLADNQYFCKVIDKQLLIPGIIKTLPVVDELHSKGIFRINYPIKTKKDEFYCKADNKIIVILNYINAKKTFDIDLYYVGKLIAQVHAISPKIQSPLPVDNFSFPNLELFKQQFNGSLSAKHDDKVTQAFKQVLQKHEEQIHQDKENLLKTCEICKQETQNLVITHGDLAGNTIAKAPENIYIIDWDEMRLSFAERDLWMLDDKPEFIKGYKSVRADFIMNTTMRNFCVLQYHFENLILKFTEILNQSRQPEDRLERIKELDDRFTQGMTIGKVRTLEKINSTRAGR